MDISYSLPIKKTYKSKKSSTGNKYKKIYSIIIALLPVIMIYNVPYVNVGLATISIGLSVPYPLLCILQRRNFKHTGLFIFLIGYLILRSEGDYLNIFLLLMVFIHVLGVFNKTIDINSFRKTLEIVSIICTVLVIIQTVVFYVLGIRFTFLIPNLILEENRPGLLSFVTAKGLFRPSAIFLEPSHYSQYCCLALLSVLFSGNRKRPDLKKAFFIAMGCILTTSGMGIGLCVGIFGWYVLFLKKGQGKLVRWIGWIMVILFIFVVLMQFNFFSQAIQRIFGEVDGYNAIWGRMFYWDSTVGMLHGKAWIFGLGALNLPLDKYMTGLMEILYCYGSIAIFILLLFLTQLAVGGRNNFTSCACVIYLALCCGANVFGFIELTFWFCLLVSSRIAQSGQQEVVR